MGLEHILKAMDQEAEEELRQVLAEAEEAAQKIVAEAQVRAREVVERHRREILPAVSAEEARLMNEARLEALKAVMQTREDLIDRAFQAAQETLKGLRSRADYPQILDRWLQAAAAELGEELAVAIGQEDAALIRTALAGSGVKAAVKSDLHSLGGLSATSGDGRILVVNTIESRLENAREVLRRGVANILLEKGTDGSRL